MSGESSIEERRNRELDRLLAKGCISGPEKDRILDSVIHQHASDSIAQPSPSLSWVKIATASAFCLLIAVVPSVWYLISSDKMELRHKGSAFSAHVDVGCENVCKQGSTLMFRITDVTRSASVTAYAIGPSGSRIWYFPSASGTAPKVEPTSEPVVLDKGVMIGPEHKQGTYHVHIFLSQRPLSRDAVRSLSASPNTEGMLLGYWVKTIEVR